MDSDFVLFLVSIFCVIMFPILVELSPIIVAVWCLNRIVSKIIELDLKGVI